MLHPPGHPMSDRHQGRLVREDLKAPTGLVPVERIPPGQVSCQ